MTWIKTIPISEASEKLIRAMEDQRALYPIEYATPVFPTAGGAIGHRRLAYPDPGGAATTPLRPSGR